LPPDLARELAMSPSNRKGASLAAPMFTLVEINLIDRTSFEIRARRGPP